MATVDWDSLLEEELQPEAQPEAPAFDWGAAIEAEDQPAQPPKQPLPGPQQQAKQQPAEQQPAEPQTRKIMHNGQIYEFGPSYDEDTIDWWANKNLATINLPEEKAGGRSRTYDTPEHRELRAGTPVTEEGRAEWAEEFSGTDADGNPVVVTPDQITPASLKHSVAERRKAEPTLAEKGYNPVQIKMIIDKTDAMERELERDWESLTTAENYGRHLDRTYTRPSEMTQRAKQLGLYKREPDIVGKAMEKSVGAFAAGKLLSGQGDTKDDTGPHAARKKLIEWRMGQRTEQEVARDEALSAEADAELGIVRPTTYAETYEEQSAAKAAIGWKEGDDWGPVAEQVRVQRLMDSLPKPTDRIPASSLPPGTWFVGGDGNVYKVNKRRQGERVHYDKLLIEANKQAYALGAKDELAESWAPRTRATWESLAADIDAKRQRLTGQDKAADASIRQGQAYSAAVEPYHQASWSPLMSRAVSGVGRTLPSMIVAGMVAGPYGAIADAALTESNTALTEGRDAELEHGWELAGYVGRAGAIEALPAMIMQKVGLGGVEKVFGGKKAVAHGIRNGLKEAGITALQEVPEELFTEGGHSLNVALSGLDPDAISWDALAETAKQTVAQTLLTVGLVESPSIYRAAKTGRMSDDWRRAIALPDKIDAGQNASRKDAAAWSRLTGETIPTEQGARTQWFRDWFEAEQEAADEAKAQVEDDQGRAFWEGGSAEARKKWLGEDGDGISGLEWDELEPSQQQAVMGSLGIVEAPTEEAAEEAPVEADEAPAEVAPQEEAPPVVEEAPPAERRRVVGTDIEGRVKQRIPGKTGMRVLLVRDDGKQSWHFESELEEAPAQAEEAPPVVEEAPAAQAEEEIEYGKEGRRHLGTPESKAHMKKGGWKLHLAVAPENYAAVDEWLDKNHPGQYKLLSGGEVGEKDFTVYVGSRADSQALSERMEAELGDMLAPAAELAEETRITPRVNARFDVEGPLRKKYQYYGRDGLPFDRDAKDAEQQVLYAEKEGDTELAAKWQKILDGHKKRIQNDLKAKYGEFFEAPQAPTEPQKPSEAPAAPEPAETPPAAAQEPSEAPKSKAPEAKSQKAKPAVPTDPQAIADAWLESKGEDKGFYERRKGLIDNVRRLAKRMRKSPWSTQEDLTVKDRKGRKRYEATRRDTQELLDLGLIQVAWDKTGMAYYALADAKVPDGFVTDPAVFDEKAKEPPKAKPTPKKKRLPHEKQAREHAKERGHDPDEFVAAAEEALVEETDKWKRKREAKLDAHRTTGLTALIISSLTNRGFDYASNPKKVGGKTGALLRAFDEQARDIWDANEDVLAERGPREEAARVVWDLLQEKAERTAPKLNTPAVLDSAEAMLAKPVDDQPSTAEDTTDDSGFDWGSGDFVEQMTLDEFVDRAVKAGWERKEALVAAALIRARARVAGVTPDQWVQDHIEDIAEGTADEKADAQQKVRGKVFASVTFKEDARAVIKALHKDVSAYSLAHELAHVFRRDLTPEELDMFTDWATEGTGRWDGNAEEKFARGFERYLAEGEAPTNELEAIFEKFLNWLKAVYDSIAGSDIDIKMDTNIRAAFGRILGGTGEVTQTQREKGPPRTAESYLEGAPQEKIDALAAKLGVEPTEEAVVEALRKVLKNAEPDTLHQASSGDATGTQGAVSSKKAAELEAGKKVKAYRAMAMIDGKLYPPMSSKDGGKLRPPEAIGKWGRSSENTSIINENGKVWITKDNGKKVEVLYNPYFHVSRSPLNDQFTSAYNRPNLVTVEVEVPASELEGGYQADRAADPVGEKDWPPGPVSKLIPGSRKVILSRYAKVIRVIPDRKVAREIAKLVKARGIVVPVNVVTPSLRAELEKQGVKIGKPRGNVKKGAFDDEMSTLYQAQQRPQWHTKSRSIIEQKMGKKASPHQVLQMLKKNGVKAEELQWSGLEELLGGDKTGKSITKEEVLTALDQGMQIEEVVKGAFSKDNLSPGEAKIYDRLVAKGALSGVQNLTPQEVGLWNKLQVAAASTTKFPNYTLPGGENYKELLLTLPGRSKSEQEKLAIQRELAELDDMRSSDMTPEQRRRYSELTTTSGNQPSIGQGAEIGYTGSHWDEPNVVVHLRMNERTDADGKKVLFIEEIQSDWHQEGRKKGYKQAPLSPAEDKRQFSKWWMEYHGVEKMPSHVKQSIDDGRYKGTSFYGQFMEKTGLGLKQTQGVPDAPFKKTWPMLGMKRAIQYAAENGFDRIAWTTGQQQADRYDLSKQVEHIEWSSDKSVTQYERGVEVKLKDSSSGPLRFDVKDGKVFNPNGPATSADLGGKNLEDVVGKEIADKILDKDHGTLRGEGLKVGGSGMKAFYDKMLPNEVNKFIKKFGAKVGGATLANVHPRGWRVRQEGDQWYVDANGAFEIEYYETREQAERELATLSETAGRWESQGEFEVAPSPASQPSFDITPKMRDSALSQGQPLYQAQQRHPIDDIIDMLDKHPELVPPKEPPKKKAPKQDAGEPEVTGTRHAKTDEMRARLGLPERIATEEETFEEWEEEAARRIAADPNYPVRLVREIIADPKSIDNIKDAVIGQYIQDLENRRNAGEDVLEEIAIAAEASAKAGSEAGRALVARQIERFSDFSIQGMAKQHSDIVGERPSAEQMEKYAEMADRIKALKGENAKLKEELARQQVQEMVAEAGKPRKAAPAKQGTARAKLQKQASAAVSAMKDAYAAFAQQAPPAPPDTFFQAQQSPQWAKLVEASGQVVKAYAELGVDSFLELTSMLSQDMGKLLPAQKDALREAWDAHRGDTRIEPMGVDPSDPSELRTVAHELTRLAVESGIEEYEAVVDAVHEELQLMVPGISRTQTAAAISQYGVFTSAPDPRSIKGKVIEIKGQIRQTLKIDDLNNAIAQAKKLLSQNKSPEEVAAYLRDRGLLPKASGQQRATPESIQRDLIRQVNDLKKKLPVSAEAREGQLATALTTAKTAVSNQMEVLERDTQALEEAVAKREALAKPVDERTPLKPDAELVKMRKELAEQRAERDRWKKEYEKIFPPTHEQRILTAEQQTQRALKQIEKLQEQLKQIKEGKETGKANRPDLVEADVKAQLKIWRERVKAAKKAAKDAEQAWENEGGALAPPKRKRKATDAQRLAAAEKLLSRRIKDVQAETKALEDGTWKPTEANPVPTSEKKEQLREELDRLEAAREDARKASPKYQAQEEAKYWDRYRKSQEKRLKFWQARLDAAKRGKLPKKRRKPTPQEEAILDKDLEIEKVEYLALAEMEKARRAEWNTGQWIGHGLLEVTSLIPKTLMLGLEWSLANRQGFFYIRSQPINAFFAIAEAMQATFSQRIALASIERIENRPNAGEYQHGEIQFTKKHGPEAKLEELFQSQFLRWLEDTKIKALLPLRTWAQLYSMFEQGNRTWSNTMKADLYDQTKRDTLMSRKFFGIDTTWTKEDMKLAGRTANIFSGRGTGLKGGNPWMDFLLLARRWAWSRIQADFVVPFQLVTPQWIGQWNADRGMRVAMAKLYIQTLMGHATKMAIMHWLYMLAAGDDEEKKPTWEWDLRSSDAWATKMGETRLKDDGGLMPAVVLAARVFTGEMKTADGEIKSIWGEDVGYGQRAADDFIINYARYKLGTGPSGILEWASGKDAVGNPVTKLDTIITRVTPLTHREIWDAEHELNVPQGTLLALEAMLGSTVSTYGPRTSHRKEGEEERQERFERDLRAMEWNSGPAPYSASLTKKQVKEWNDTIKHTQQSVIHAGLTKKPDRAEVVTMKEHKENIESHRKASEKFNAMRKNLTHEQAQELLAGYYERTQVVRDDDNHVVYDKSGKPKYAPGTIRNKSITTGIRPKDSYESRAIALAKLYGKEWDWSGAWELAKQRNR